jgi:sulfur relay (sulfurtransferase) complex TusBCD TusD component (DsrE family)
VSVIEHQRGEKPSADSPGCEEYFLIQCDLCGEYWGVGPKSDELTANMNVCAECERTGEDVHLCDRCADNGGKEDR